jgi:ribonuclease P protein subunit POP4
MNENMLSKEELIGLTVRINECSDPEWLNRKGVIIDETKNTFLIREKNIKKRIAKNIAKFEFNLNNQKVKINGSKILYKPEDRIKKTR